MIKLWQGVAMRTGCDSQVGSIPACHIVQFSDRTQLAMTPSDTGRASSRHMKRRYHLNVVFQFALEYYFFEVIEMKPINFRKSEPTIEELSDRIDAYNRRASELMKRNRPLTREDLTDVRELRKSLDSEYHEYNLSRNDFLHAGPGLYHRYYKWVQDTVQYTSGRLTSDLAVSFLSDVGSATIMWKVDKRFAETKKSHHF